MITKIRVGTTAQTILPTATERKAFRISNPTGQDGNPEVRLALFPEGDLDFDGGRPLKAGESFEVFAQDQANQFWRGIQAISDSEATPAVPATLADVNAANVIGGGGIASLQIAVDTAGNVYWTDTEANKVRKFDGEAVTDVADGWNAPTGIAIDGADLLYVVDADGVKKVEDNVATIIDNVVPYGSTRIAVKSDGSQVLLTGGPDGRGYNFPIPAYMGVPPSFGPVEGAGFNATLGAAYDADGNIYALERLVGGSVKVWRFDQYGGTPTLLAQGLSDVDVAIGGIAVDSAGRIFVAAGNVAGLQQFAGGQVYPINNGLIGSAWAVVAKADQTLRVLNNSGSIVAIDFNTYLIPEVPATGGVLVSVESKP